MERSNEWGRRSGEGEARTKPGNQLVYNKGMVKVSFYIAQYPVRWTAQIIIIIIYLFYIALDPCTVISASQLKGVTLHH